MANQTIYSTPPLAANATLAKEGWNGPPGYPTPPLAASSNKQASDNYRNIAGSLVERLFRLVDSVHRLHYNVTGQSGPTEQPAQAGPANSPIANDVAGTPLSESLLTAHEIVSRLENDLKSLVEKV